MSAARQRVLRTCGCTGGGNNPSAVQRQTVRALIDNRRATSRTVSKSGVIARCEGGMSDPKKTRLFAKTGLGAVVENKTKNTVRLYMLQEKKIEPTIEWREMA
jgi:hypothetical protein